MDKSFPAAPSFSSAFAFFCERLVNTITRRRRRNFAAESRRSIGVSGAKVYHPPVFL